MNNRSKLISSTQDYENDWIKVVDRVPYHMQAVRVVIENPIFGISERFKNAVFLGFDNTFYDSEEQTQLNWVTKWRPLYDEIKNDVPLNLKTNMPRSGRMKWIKCSERMPELYQWVLVCDTPKGTGEPRSINILRWNEKEWESAHDYDDDSPTFSDIIYYMNLSEVTHWMPLPQEPVN